MTPDKWQMCGRKAYETLSKANRAAVRHATQYPYQCPYCFCWHLATKMLSKNEERAILRQIMQ